MELRDKKREKKGEITTKQLVTIIILIVSFTVILYFIFRLNLTGTTDKEICHNSVVLQAKSFGIAGSLDCKTSYVCISGGGGCEGILEDSVVEVNPEDKNEVFKAIADEMADCWWMFGEGKLDYTSKNIVSDKVGCAICSVIKFDEEIIDRYSEEGIRYQELLEFLEREKVSDDETYLHYLTSYYSLEDLFGDFEEINGYSQRLISLEEKHIIQTVQAKESLIKEILKWKLNDYYMIPPFLYEIGESPLGVDGCDEYVTNA